MISANLVDPCSKYHIKKKNRRARELFKREDNRSIDSVKQLYSPPVSFRKDGETNRMNLNNVALGMIGNGNLL